MRPGTSLLDSYATAIEDFHGKQNLLFANIDKLNVFPWLVRRCLFSFEQSWLKHFNNIYSYFSHNSLYAAVRMVIKLLKDTNKNVFQNNFYGCNLSK